MAVSRKKLDAGKFDMTVKRVYDNLILKDNIYLYEYAISSID